MAQSILLPDGPLLLVHKGWTVSSKGASRTAMDTQNRKSNPLGNCSDITVKGPPMHKANGQQSRPRPTRHYEFVNATQPLMNRDENVRALVRSHVKKGVARCRGIAGEGLKTQSTSKFCPSIEINAPRNAQKANEPTTGLPAGSSKLSPICPGTATAFFGAVLPSTMERHFHHLIDYCT